MNENYWTAFLNSSLASNPTTIFMLLLLFLSRMLPIIAQAPFFGSKVLPGPVKIVLGISFFVIFLPQLLAVTHEAPSYTFHSVILAAKELFIGYILGFFISIPFMVVQSAGMFIDHQRGGASLMVNDPTIQNQSSPLGTIFNLVLIYLFYLVDGPFLFLDALQKSYEIVPPDQFINKSFFENTSAFWETATSLLNTMMKLSFKLASPALIIILMTDVFLGIANRLATQVQITFLGMPLKSLLALLVLWLGWDILTRQMTLESLTWLNTIQKVVYMLNPDAAAGATGAAPG